MKRKFIFTTIFSFCMFNNSFADNLKITSDNFISTIKQELNAPENNSITTRVKDGYDTILNFENNPKLMNKLTNFITNTINDTIKKFSREFKLKNIVKNNFQTETGKYLRQKLIKEINNNLFKDDNNKLNDWCFMSNPKEKNIIVMMPIYMLEQHDSYDVLINISCWYDTKKKTSTLKKILIVR